MCVCVCVCVRARARAHAHVVVYTTYILLQIYYLYTTTDILLVSHKTTFPCVCVMILLQSTRERFTTPSGVTENRDVVMPDVLTLSNGLHRLSNTYKLSLLILCSDLCVLSC